MNGKIKNWLKDNWFKIVAIILLLHALNMDEYSYTGKYLPFLRWIVFTAAGYSAYLFYKEKNGGWAWLFGVIAIFFNPLTPFNILKDNLPWQFINLVCAVIFFVSFFKTHRQVTENTK